MKGKDNATGWHSASATRRGLARLTAIAILILSAISTGSAQSLSTKVWFKQSHSEIDTAFRCNGAHLERMIAAIDSMRRADSVIQITAIRVVGAASPEGSYRFNKELSRRRAESIFRYLSGRLELDESIVERTGLGRDWAGLQILVAKDGDMPDSARVAAVISTAIEAVDDDDATANDAALQQLRHIDGGKPYRRAYRRDFPDLRYSQIFVDYFSRPAPQVIAPAPELPDTDHLTAVGEVVTVDYPIADISLPAASCSPFYMDLRTNMLYDALALPNIGAEFYLGRGWSVGVNGMYGWWSNSNRHRYWRAYGGEINARRWLGQRAAEKPLSGHHLGLYAGVVTYDFEFGHTGYMGGKPGGTLLDRCNYYGGIEYGYSLAVGRRLNIDFSIGIGYLGGKYVKYTPCPEGGYLWQSTHRLGWFGPTKAEISLVWLIGCGNQNEKK